MRLGIVKMENFVFLLPAALAFLYLWIRQDAARYR